MFFNKTKRLDITNKKLFFFILFLISISQLLSQISNLEKVDIDVLQIDMNGKIVKCKTDESGKFAISFSNESNFVGNKIDANVKIIPSNSLKSLNNNSVKITLNKNDNSYYEFNLQYDNVKKTYLITEQNNIKGNTQIKREKGDVSKPCDKYMGQVAHF